MHFIFSNLIFSFPVVFQLHETFPKPKRVLREPPYVVKESGYAGFEIPISVYLKNKDEPKKFHISYDLNLQPSGPAINKVLLHSENISNPNDEFRKKLLKGGAVSFQLFFVEIKNRGIYLHLFF